MSKFLSGLVVVVAMALGGCVTAPDETQKTESDLGIDIGLGGLHICLSLGTGCCESNTDCPSSACRPQHCDTSVNKCVVDSDTCGCATDLDCGDSNLCTVDHCVAQGQTHVCTHTPLLTCCLTDGNCDDHDSCTIDTCNITLPALTGTCGHVTVPDPLCCNSAADCDPIGGCGNVTCDTVGLQGYSTCVAHSGGSSCCASKDDCPVQACKTALCTATQCVYAPATGPGCCTLAAQCPTKNACQLASCTENQCEITASATAGCCTSATDCAAPQDSCHVASCTDNQCQVTAICDDAGAPPEPKTSPDAGVQTGPSETWTLGGSGCSVGVGSNSKGTWLFIVGAVLVVLHRRKRS